MAVGGTERDSHVAAMQLQPTTTAMDTKEAVRRYHSRPPAPGQCGSLHVQDVAAPLPVVWSLVRRFGRPQAYKKFVRECRMLDDADGGVPGSVREVRVISGLPAGVSVERLDVLDDERHVFGFSIVGGDHRLANYRSTTSLHEGGSGRATVVVESYVVDVPPGSTAEETCIFANTIVGCNLRSLAGVAERMVR